MLIGGKCPLIYHHKKKPMSIIKKVIQEYLESTYNHLIITRFISWFNKEKYSDEKDQALFEIWNGLDVSTDDSTVQSFNTFKANNLTSNQSNLNKDSKYYLKRLGRIAAILALPLLSSLLTYYTMNRNRVPVIDNTRFVECIVPNGETRTIVLPDSSVVKLNSGTILVYPEEFRADYRDIYLNGEAFFTVKRNTEKPFWVKTTDMDVEVLGTVFNVLSYTSDQISSTTLESGKVRIHLKNNGENLILVPNEQIVYNRQTNRAEVKNVDAVSTTSWISGNFHIESSSMEDLIKAIERKYGVNVYLSSTRFKNEKITMRFINNENLNDCMNILQQIVPDLKYEIDGDNVFIY